MALSRTERAWLHPHWRRARIESLAPIHIGACAQLPVTARAAILRDCGL